MRQIVLDTETTGISPDFPAFHRIIEIGCVELIDRKLTKNHFHVYLNPQRDIDAGAFRVHGISREFLQDKSLFKDIALDFIGFINDAELIIHNAPFDLAFINAELRQAKLDELQINPERVCDTLALSRQKNPGRRHSLDVLCERYEIDNSKRSKHGALLDAEILAYVYLAMTGGQGSLFDEKIEGTKGGEFTEKETEKVLVSTSPVLTANPEELQKHKDFIQFLIKQSGLNLWDSEPAL